MAMACRTNVPADMPLHQHQLRAFNTLQHTAGMRCRTVSACTARQQTHKCILLSPASITATASPVSTQDPLNAKLGGDSKLGDVCHKAAQRSL
jgi:hypothetical protein